MIAISFTDLFKKIYKMSVQRFLFGFLYISVWVFVFFFIHIKIHSILFLQVKGNLIQLTGENIVKFNNLK